MVKHKLDVLRQHCEVEGRDYNSIERTNLTSLLLARTEAELQAKRNQLGVLAQFRGSALTVSQAVDLIGEYQRVGSQLFITGFVRNDWESMELLAGEIMPHFAA